MGDVTDIASSPRMRFSAAMDEMEVAYNMKVATLRREVYWKYLKAVPIDHLVAAVPLIVANYTSFPKIPQWRKMAERARVQRESPHQTGDGVPLRELPTPEHGGVFCMVCRDKGWEECMVQANGGQWYKAVRPHCRKPGENPRVTALFKLGKTSRTHFQDEEKAETRERRGAEEPGLYD